METPQNKYALRTLHEEIGLIDRKIAHQEKYETFPTEEARATAAKKLNQKRALLISKAQALSESGTEFKESEVPKSMRPAEAEVELEPAVSE